MSMTMTILALALTSNALAAKEPCARDSDDMATTSSELMLLYQGTRKDYEEQSPDQAGFRATLGREDHLIYVNHALRVC